jgi:hypothetical protein
MLFEGELIPMVVAAERARLPYPAVRMRVTKLGWSDEKALLTPLLANGTGALKKIKVEVRL